MSNFSVKNLIFFIHFMKISLFPGAIFLLFHVYLFLTISGLREVVIDIFGIIVQKKT